VLERAAAGRRKGGGAEAGGLEAPMPGVVTKVLVAQGDRVQRGQPLVAVEAMKMEHMVRAPRDGQVKAVRVKQGELVGGGAALLELEETGSS
jgi:3-methylcrotonyl-CoA carboxylase alpha subunit